MIINIVIVSESRKLKKQERTPLLIIIYQGLNRVSKCNVFFQKYNIILLFQRVEEMAITNTYKFMGPNSFSRTIFPLFVVYTYLLTYLP